MKRTLTISDISDIRLDLQDVIRAKQALFEQSGSLREHLLSELSLLESELKSLQSI